MTAKRANAGHEQQAALRHTHRRASDVHADNVHEVVTKLRIARASSYARLKQPRDNGVDLRPSVGVVPRSCGDDCTEHDATTVSRTPADASKGIAHRYALCGLTVFIASATATI